MESYPKYILNIIEAISDLSMNKGDHYNLTNELFDKNHDFNKLVSYLTNYFQETIIEQSHGNYFIMSLKDYYLGIRIIEYENNELMLYMDIFDNLNKLRNMLMYSSFEDNGNYNKYYKY